MARKNMQALLNLDTPEAAALRAFSDGLVVETLLRSPTLFANRHLLRVAFSTRCLAGSHTLTSSWLDEQSQLHPRTRRDHWNELEPLMGPPLDACLVLTAHLWRTRGASLEQMKTILEMFGLDVSEQRLVDHLAVLVDRRYLHHTEGRRWVTTAGDTDPTPSIYPQFALFQLLTSITQGVVAKFQGQQGSWRFSCLGLLKPEEHIRLHRTFLDRAEVFLQMHHQDPSLLDPGAGRDHVLLTLSTLGAPLAEQTEAQPADVTDGLELLLMTAGAECMRRLGPWPVASALIERRLVERTGMATGLSGGPLYRHIMARWDIKAAATPRSWLEGPGLYPQSPDDQFFRGVVLETCIAIRRILIGHWPEPMLEVALKRQVERDRGTRDISPTTWRNALRLLMDDDIVKPVSVRDGMSYVMRHEPLFCTPEELAEREKQLRDILPHVVTAVHAVAQKRSFAHCTSRVWCLPRPCLKDLSELAREVIKSQGTVELAPWKRLPEGNAARYGLMAGSFMAQARVFPLIY